MEEVFIEKIVKHKKQYMEKYDMYLYFCQKLKNKLEKMLLEKGITYVKIETRVKTAESFISKVIRGKNKYENPFESMTDIIGVRVITYYMEDTNIVGDLIEKEFIIDKKNSIDKSNSLDYNQFGYRSIHYVVDISKCFGDLEGWTDLHVIKAEIQVRTVLQHSWAAIDHRLRYKNIVEMPDDVKRRLFRISALLELADEEFENIKNYLVNIEKYYLRRFEMGDYNIELNPTSIAVYIKSNSENMKKFQATLKKIGLIDTPITYEEKPINDFINFMQMIGIKTIKEIDEVLGAAEENMYNIKDDVGKLLTDDNKMIFQISNYINIFIFILLFRGSIENMRKIKRINEENIEDIIKIREKIKD